MDGVNSILELMVNSEIGIWIGYLTKMELKLINLELNTKKLNRQINLPVFFNSEIFLPWQYYFEYKLLKEGIKSKYSQVPTRGKKMVGLKKRVNTFDCREP